MIDACRECKSKRVIMEMADDSSLGLRCKDCGAFTVPKSRKSGMSAEEIEAGKTPKGGFSKAQLQEWGVPYPPPKGWKKALMNGDDPAKLGGKPDAAELLRMVVLAVVEAGQGSLLHDMDDLHDFFGAKPKAEADAALAELQKTLRNDSDGDVPWQA